MSTRHELTIEGMSCGHCVRTVEDVLRGMSGVRVISVEVGRATVELEDGVVFAELAAALAEEDFRIAV